MKQNLLERASQWLDRQAQRREERQREKRRREIEARAALMIQAREYQGRIYLAVGQEPIVEADSLALPLPQAIEAARQAWTAYHLGGAPMPPAATGK